MMLHEISLALVTNSTLLIVFLILLGKVLHRRLVHPLRSFPGPWLNMVSPIPSALMLLLGRQHSYAYRLHEAYGSVVRTAPDELNFTSAGAWEDIYGLRKGVYMEKSPLFIGAVSPTDGQVGIGLARGKEHARQRRALAPGLSREALIRQQEILQTHVYKFIEAIRTMTRNNQAIDISRWSSYLTFDIIGDLCFAEPFGCLDQGSETEWSNSVTNILIFATWDQAIRRVAGVDTWIRKLLVKFLIPSKVAKWRVLHVVKTREKTHRRLENENLPHPDIIYHLLQNENSKKSLTSTETVLNMALLVSAGSETTSILLTTWAYLVCSNPKTYTRLVKEIRGSFQSSEDIKLDEVMNLSYLGATINEALRLFPPGSTTQQRVVPTGGAFIDGFHIPAGLTVGVSPWAAARSPTSFHEPNAFHPERWLDDHDSRFANDKLHASQPFGVGPKSCIGKNLSYFESRLAITHLLWNFDLKLEVAGEYGVQNRLWSTDPTSQCIQSFQALLKPNLWVRFVERD